MKRFEVEFRILKNLQFTPPQDSEGGPLSLGTRTTNAKLERSRVSLSRQPLWFGILPCKMNGGQNGMGSPLLN